MKTMKELYERVYDINNEIEKLIKHAHVAFAAYDDHAEAYLAYEEIDKLVAERDTIEANIATGFEQLRQENMAKASKES